MQLTPEASTATPPLSEGERTKVREQMNRLLETHHFKNSRRYPALLRFVVEETLAGRGEYLKERLLGIQVFDRPADYDTATDPIVRVTIAEIRKRIAQYYHDEAHDAEIRIELLPGRYAPEFRARRDMVAERGGAALLDVPAAAVEVAGAEVPAAAAVLAPAVLPGGEGEAGAAAAKVGWGKRWRAGWKGWAAGVLVGAAAGVVGMMVGPGLGRWVRPNATDDFWAPLMESQRTILFCLPTDVGKKSLPDGWTVKLGRGLPGADTETKAASSKTITFLEYESLGENVVYSDMLAMVGLVNAVVQRRRDYRVALHVYTTLDDLRQGPTVLIGGLDNPWTMRALSGMPFRFAGSDAAAYWIEDVKHPERHSRSLDLKLKYGAVTRDYALIARVHNEQTGQVQVIVAGIGMSGTAAAGGFLADEARLQELRQRVGAGFKKRDFEVVLGTDVVNGTAGNPKIEDVAVW